MVIIPRTRHLENPLINGDVGEGKKRNGLSNSFDVSHFSLVKK